MIEDLLVRLRADEGLRLFPYLDTVGKVTIGYGRNLTDRGISALEAEALLARDAEDAIRECRQRFEWFDSLSSARQIVVVSMAFNLGLPRLMAFVNFLAAVKRRDFTTASAEMLKSAWATQVGARADRLAEMMRHG